MNFDFLSKLSPSDISNVISFATVLISISGSLLTARYTARSEIRKQREAFQHSDAVRRHDEETAMLSAVSEYLGGGYEKHRRAALASIYILQNGASPELSAALSELAEAISSNQLLRANECFSAAASLLNKRNHK